MKSTRTEFAVNKAMVLNKKIIGGIALLSVIMMQGQTISTAEKVTDTLPKAKNLEFKVIPFVNYNRNLEFMFGAVPMIMYRVQPSDTISPKSVSGISAVYTTNKSYFIAFFNKLFLDENRWRIQVFAMLGDKNSQVFVDDIDQPDFYGYGTDMTMFNIGIQRKIFGSLYGGINYSYAHYDTDFEDGIMPASGTTTNGLQFSMMYDSRNSVYYATKGEKIKARWITFPEWIGNAAEANKIYAEYNKYFSVRDDKDVIAARFSGKFGLGNIAFEQQVTLGGTDIRGYSEGKFRGDGMMALQGEYRYNLGKKIGLVGFVGMATIYGSDNTDFNWDIYPGGGAGVRYRIFDDPRFNVGLDAAVGKDDWGLYFKIGEAF